MTPLEKSDQEFANSLRGFKSQQMPLIVQPQPTPKVVQRKVAFDLPFVVMVEDNFGNGRIQGYWRNLRNFNQTRVDKAKPLIVDTTSLHNSYNQTPLDTPPPYLVDTKYGMVKITMLKVNADDVVGGQSNFEFQGSVSKTFTYTTVLVEYGDKGSSLNIADNRTFSELTQQAVIAFNFFLTHYKIIANRVHMPPVTPQGIGKMYIIDLLETGRVVSMYSARLFEQPIPIEDVIPSELNATLRRVCIDNIQPDTFNLLYNEAWSKLTLMEWRMAVISGVIMFEEWLSRYLRKIYRANGVEEKDLKWKFMTNEPKKDDRKNLGIIEIAEKLLLDSMGYDFKKTSEFKDIKEKAIIMRNSIIHRGKVDVTQKEAYDSVHAVMNAISAISVYSMVYQSSKGIIIPLSIIDNKAR